MIRIILRAVMILFKNIYILKTLNFYQYGNGLFRFLDISESMVTDQALFYLCGVSDKAPPVVKSSRPMPSRKCKNAVQYSTSKNKVKPLVNNRMPK